MQQLKTAIVNIIIDIDADIEKNKDDPGQVRMLTNDCQLYASILDSIESGDSESATSTWESMETGCTDALGYKARESKEVKVQATWFLNVEWLF